MSTSISRTASFVVFVGPSGCGKSTLLRMIAGLEEITSGELLIDGEDVNDVAPAERGLAMVFQSYALYPHMTVARKHGLRPAACAASQRPSATPRCVEAARMLELEAAAGPQAAGSFPAASASASPSAGPSCAQPKVFLFDEPLSNLDAELRVQMRIEIASLHESLDATMIYVTHDQVEAMTLADKIVVLRRGRIEQAGHAARASMTIPTTCSSPASSARPRMNLLEGRIASLDGQWRGRARATATGCG